MIIFIDVILYNFAQLCYFVLFYFYFFMFRNLFLISMFRNLCSMLFVNVSNNTTETNSLHMQ